MSCITFQNTLGEIKMHMTALDRMYETALETGVINPDFDEIYQKAFAQKEEFMEAYKKEAILILRNWRVRRQLAHRDIETEVEFEDNGRVVLAASYFLHSDCEYFPAIIREVKGYLGFNESAVKNADFIEEVGKNLRIQKNPMTFARLQKVGERLDAEAEMDFEEAFPSLNSVGFVKFSAQTINSEEKISVVVATEQMRQQVLKLKEQGRLQFEGEVKLTKEIV